LDAGATVAAGGSTMGEAAAGDTVALGCLGLGAMLLTGFAVVDGGLRTVALGIIVVDGTAVAGDADFFGDDPFPDPFPEPFPDPFPDGSLLGLDLG
jgi:hypothetical protein